MKLKVYFIIVTNAFTSQKEKTNLNSMYKCITNQLFITKDQPIAFNDMKNTIIKAYVLIVTNVVINPRVKRVLKNM